MAKILTIKEIEAAKPNNTEYKITVDRGLYIRVATNGVKTWLVRYVVGGRQKQYRLPKPYGTTGDGFMSLVDAKALNASIQALAKSGIDYQEQEAEKLQKNIDEKNAERISNLTFQDLFYEWTRDGVMRADKNKMLTGLFNKHALPKLGNIPLRQLTEKNLLDTLRLIFDQGKSRTAVMLYKDIKQMLKWAEKRKPYRALLVDGNPAELVDIEILIPDDYEEKRDRCLSDDEIRNLNTIFIEQTIAYKEAAHKYGIDRPLKKETQLALWICLSTLCRIGELLMTEWKHVDFDARTWFIPKENVKGTRRNKQAQHVYLSDFALSQFRQLHAITGDSKWAFPAKNTSKRANNHVCVKSVSKQVGDRQTQFKQRTKDLKNRVNSNSLVIGVEGWTPHDLRRTGATMMQGDLKIPLDVIDRCQNHVLAGSKVRRHYLHHEYADEKREAWNKLGDRLEAILKASNVVSLKIA
jgi:integrase